MFTGIVEDLGTIRDVRRGAVAARLRVETKLPLTEVHDGDSISVDGACLTVVAKASDSFEVDAAVETLARTTLGSRVPGDRVHLERALRLSDRLDGHLVTGHVDGVGRLLSRTPRGTALELSYEGPVELMRYVITKGSIAVDGVSLTVNECDRRRFQVVLIPHTLSTTQLGDRAVGSPVNLEVDVIGKYVERFVQRSDAGAIDRDFLRLHGFAK